MIAMKKAGTYFCFDSSSSWPSTFRASSRLSANAYPAALTRHENFIIAAGGRDAGSVSTIATAAEACASVSTKERSKMKMNRTFLELRQ
jgi:hypothetical protein